MTAFAGGARSVGSYPPPPPVMLKGPRSALGSHGNTTHDSVENAVLHIVCLETGKKKGERFVILHALLLL